MFTEEHPTENSPWLHRYRHVLERGSLVLDLGCGTGADSVEIESYGCRVISLDSDLSRVQQVPDSIPTIRMVSDMSQGLPFRDGAFDCVISSLSLHYFTEADTRRVLDEVRRILVSDGWFVCRVNATGDVNFGYGAGVEIESSLFQQPGGHLKRFFDKDMLRSFLDPCFRLEQVESRTILQRGVEKRTIECLARRR